MQKKLVRICVLLLMLAVLILPNQLQANAATLDWVLDSDGTLTISGSGPMEFDWNAAVRVPWSPYAAQIKKVVIEEGVTSVADSAFYECANLQEVQLPDSLRYIYHQAFGDCTSLTGITIPAGVGDKPVLVCTGLSFADSLSASAAELPILLVWKNLTETQKAFLGSLKGNEFYVIGGESAVSKSMEEQIAAYGVTERVQGANRFETSIAIAERFFYKPETAVVAYAWNFPDGLCGGPLAATMDAPLILTMDKYEARAAEYLQAQPIREATILGGESLIPEKSVEKIFGTK